jgi:hypothetical protein
VVFGLSFLVIAGQWKAHLPNYSKLCPLPETFSKKFLTIQEEEDDDENMAFTDLVQRCFYY